MELLDAEAAHRADPRTFSIPRRAVRESLRPGDVVKLLFRVDPPDGWVDVERMWVIVERVDGDAYAGRLDNDPAYVRDLRYGEPVTFGAHHVAARYAAPNDPLFTDPDAAAVVSRRVWDDGAWPARLERRPIPDDAFSGWFVMAGDESPAYKADPSNFTPVRQQDLFDRFRVLDSGLEGPTGTVMAWNEIDLEYQRAEP